LLLAGGLKIIFQFLLHSGTDRRKKEFDMLWALLALLGVPLWLVLGGLSVSLWHRHKFRQRPDVFTTKIRLESGSNSGFKEKWPPVSNYAHWVHDVLLVHKGLGLMPTTPVGVMGLEGSPSDADPEQVKRLGESPKLLRIKLDDGSILQLAVPVEHLPLALGPFEAEAV
jgi:hypothetical protein